jgi:hypothetical protein
MVAFVVRDVKCLTRRAKGWQAAVAVFRVVGFTAAPQQEGGVGMNAGRSMGFRAFALATVAGLALSGAAMAQKPSPLGAPTAPALPTAKPPPLNAPQQMRPAPLRPTPPVVQAPPSTRPPAVAAPQVIPPNEPAAVTRLRGLFDAQTRLSYASVETLDGGAGEQVRMTGVVLERPGKRATVEEVTINGLRTDGVAEAVLRGFSTTESGNSVNIGMLRLVGLTVPRNPGGGPPQPEQVNLDTLQLANLQVTGTTTVTLATLELAGWTAGKPSRLVMEGLQTVQPGAGMVDGVRMARLAMAGVDAARILGAVIRGERVPSLVGSSSLEMRGLEVLGGGQPLGGIADLQLAANITAEDGSGSGTFAARGIRVEPMPMLAQWLTRFGYRAIEGEISASTVHNASTGRIEVNDLTIAAREAGTLTFSVTLDGVTAERMQASDFSQARLISAALGYADASLFGRFLAMQSAQTRTPEAQLREQFAAMVSGALSQQGAVALDPIRDAVLSFIRGQAQSVQIQVKPPEPIGMAQMQSVPPSPAELQRMLGVTATAR